MDILSELSRHFLALCLCLITGFILLGCSKPELTFEEPPGAPGEFCVTAQDCAAPLRCNNNRCCGDAACDQRCASAAEKLGLSASHGGGADRIRRCLARCCAKAQ
ncbi:MAG: hypothetical protein VX223_06360 [Myxococcota bacterium]|nr:hypothetical protein [Myxococcota bacterium]